MSEKLYLLRISMSDIKPEIWRRFVVPASIRLDDLHIVIQVFMGWGNYHLYEFVKGEKRYSQQQDSVGVFSESSDFQLSDLAKRKGSKFTYYYDFGDYWKHEITVEESRYSDAKLIADIVCLDGARACPPEDVGGIWGYENLREALGDPDHEEHESMIEWCGGDFDSEFFSLLQANKRLDEYFS